MKQSLYIFNPEHDLALANDDLNFNPPQSALKLATDLECLPVWYAKPGSHVFCRSGNYMEWLKMMQKLFPALDDIDFKQITDTDKISDIQPWGWDKVIKKQFDTLQTCNTQLLPDEAQLSVIRELSHRRTALVALDFLKQNITTHLLPETAKELTEMHQTESFEKDHGSVIFKAPWSGSGKGLNWVRRGFTDSHKGWCRNVIEKQGSVIAEELYEVAQNFAMLFSCENHQCTFAGYSLFDTEKGIYRGNLLLSDKAIQNFLTTNFVTEDLLTSVQKYLTQFIQTSIAGSYSGPLGVDMFVYKEDEIYKLHPCVEINLRMTMGYVARVFYDRFVSPESSGYFRLDHMPEKQSLFDDHLDRKNKFALSVHNGRINTGYLSLTPVQPTSKYRIQVEIQQPSPDGIQLKHEEGRL